MPHSHLSSRTDVELQKPGDRAYMYSPGKFHAALQRRETELWGSHLEDDGRWLALRLGDYELELGIQPSNLRRLQVVLLGVAESMGKMAEEQEATLGNVLTRIEEGLVLEGEGPARLTADVRREMRWVRQVAEAEAEVVSE